MADFCNMIDSVTAFFPEGAIDPDILKDFRSIPDTGFRGRLGNLSIRQVPDGAWVSGSLPKYWRGENATSLSRAELLEAICKLERETGLDAGRSIVYAVEFGATIPVDCPPRDYLAGWGTVPRFPKDTFGNGDTVLYKVERRSFQGYDKGKEMKEKDQRDLPAGFPGKHALRLEYKLKCKPNERLGGPSSLRDLAGEVLLLKLRRQWLEFYRAIPKRGVPYLKTAVSTPKEFKRFLATGGVLLLGQEEVDRLVESSRASGGCTAANASRMRRMVRELNTAPGIRQDDRLVRELDGKVEEIARTGF